MKVKIKCECGCGSEFEEFDNYGRKRRFCNSGHVIKGKHRSLEHRQKISNSLKGKPTWCKGLTAKTDERIRRRAESNMGKVMSEEAKRKISKWHKGRHHSKEHTRRSADAHRGKHPSIETRKKMSIARKGKPISDATKIKLSKALKGKYAKERASNWRGGKSFEPYGLDFDNATREQIRQRDQYRCQECFRHQSELFRNTRIGIRPCKLMVHHIDYNKNNNNPNNLISLCLQWALLLNTHSAPKVGELLLKGF